MDPARPGAIHCRWVPLNDLAETAELQASEWEAHIDELKARCDGGEDPDELFEPIYSLPNLERNISNWGDDRGPRRIDDLIPQASLAVVVCRLLGCDVASHFERLRRKEAEDWRLALLCALYPGRVLPEDAEALDPFFETVQGSHLWARGIVGQETLDDMRRMERGDELPTAWAWFEMHGASDGPTPRIAWKPADTAREWLSEAAPYWTQNDVVAIGNHLGFPDWLVEPRDADRRRLPAILVSLGEYLADPANAGLTARSTWSRTLVVKSDFETTTVTPPYTLLQAIADALEHSLSNGLADDEQPSVWGALRFARLADSNPMNTGAALDEIWARRTSVARVLPRPLYLAAENWKREYGEARAAVLRADALRMAMSEEVLTQDWFSPEFSSQLREYSALLLSEIDVMLAEMTPSTVSDEIFGSMLRSLCSALKGFVVAEIALLRHGRPSGVLNQVEPLLRNYARVLLEITSPSASAAEALNSLADAGLLIHAYRNLDRAEVDLDGLFQLKAVASHAAHLRRSSGVDRDALGRRFVDLVTASQVAALIELEQSGWHPGSAVSTARGATVEALAQGVARSSTSFPLVNHMCRLAALGWIQSDATLSENAAHALFALAATQAPRHVGELTPMTGAICQADIEAPASLVQGLAALAPLSAAAYKLQAMACARVARDGGLAPAALRRAVGRILLA